MINSELEEVRGRVVKNRALWLFLDYDGTLAEFAPTPETIEPNPQIAGILKRLASNSELHVAIISGRRLHDVQALIPVAGIHLAGTYGVEMITAEGTLIQRVDRGTIRPLLEKVKPKWAAIVKDKAGFYIEDKDWALALHARFSADEDAEDVLAMAREVVERELPEEHFRILGGHKFLEAAPLLAHKGSTVEYMLENFPLPEAQLIYIGDDDKDEEAFEIILEHGGTAIKVVNHTHASQPTRANFTLESPAAVHLWLESLLEKL